MEILEGKVLVWLENAQFVKAKPGVYALYDKNFDVIYIGGSNKLQKEFTNFVDTNFENDECKQKTTHIKERLLKTQKNYKTSF